MAEKNSPVIRMTAYRITDIQYKHYLNEEDFSAVSDDIKSPNIKMDPAVATDGLTGQVRMTAHVVRKQVRQIGDITVIGFFEFRDDVNDEADKYRYLSINGSAMIYPYLRVTVSMLTALDNPDTTVLPTLNFVDVFQHFSTQNDSGETKEKSSSHEDHHEGTNGEG